MRIVSFFSIGLFSFLTLMHPVCVAVAPPTVSAKQIYLIDLTTHKVLCEKDARTPAPPSSMTKIMTAYIVFKLLKAGTIKETDLFKVSQKAYKAEGSRMFLDINSQAKVIDMLRGLIIQSGNDASIALAENIAGNEAAFAEMMNQMGRELGLQESNFVNASGLPDPSHVMSARDLAIVAEHSIEDFPELYALYAEKTYTYNNITQPNRNPLLYSFGNCDGIKTGYTEAGGYGLVASAKQNGRRLLLVLNGAPSAKVRAEESEKLMTWGFTAFTSPLLLRQGEALETADVWIGSQGTVRIGAGSNVFLTVPKLDLMKIKVQLVYHTPIEPPLVIGQQVGDIVVTVPGEEPRTYPLVSLENVQKAGLFSRFMSTLNYLVYGDSNG